MFVRSFVHLFVRSFVCSFVRLFVRSFVRSFVCSFVRSFVCSFVHSFVTIVQLSLDSTVVKLYLIKFQHKLWKSDRKTLKFQISRCNQATVIPTTICDIITWAHGRPEGGKEGAFAPHIFGHLVKHLVKVLTFCVKIPTFGQNTFAPPTKICSPYKNSYGCPRMGSVYEFGILSILCHSSGDEKFIQFTSQHLTHIQGIVTPNRAPFEILAMAMEPGLIRQNGDQSRCPKCKQTRAIVVDIFYSPDGSGCHFQTLTGVGCNSVRKHLNIVSILHIKYY